VASTIELPSAVTLGPLIAPEIGAAAAGIAQRVNAKQLTAAPSQCFISMMCPPWLMTTPLRQSSPALYLTNATMGDSEVKENCRKGHEFGVTFHQVHHVGRPSRMPA